MAIFDPLLSALFPGGERGSLSVLYFHQIPESDSNPLAKELELPEFERILDVLENDFRVLPLNDALRALSAGSLPDRAVALTFDDGYVDWRSGVAPALYQRGMHATFFIACGQLTGQLLWYNRFRALLHARASTDLVRRAFGQIVGEEEWSLPDYDRPFVLEHALKYAPPERRDAVLAEFEKIVGAGVSPDASLTDEDIRDFHSMGFGIGAHTLTHPILANCSDEDAWREIADSRAYLEGVIGGKVDGFAYPNGKPHLDFTAVHADMVKRAGYEFAVSTQQGAATAATPRYAVPRFGLWSSRRLALLRHLAMNRFESGAGGGQGFGMSVAQGRIGGTPSTAVSSESLMSPGAATPSISVVIPVYNCWNLLGEAIDSVIAQNVPVLEVLVINDGSSDGDYQYFARTYPGVRIVDKPHEGVSASRNLGIREAKGDVIAFLDADDVWLPGKLAAQIRLLQQHPDTGAVFGRFEKWLADDAGVYRPWREFGTVPDTASCDPARSGWLYGKLVMGLLVGMNTAIVRKSLLLEMGGFDESRQIGEDYELWLRISRHTRMMCLGEVVALYRIHPASATQRLRDASDLAQVLEGAYQRWGLEAPHSSGLTDAAYRRRLAQVHFEHGYTHFWRGSLRLARQAFRRALQYEAEHARARLYAMLSRFKSAVVVARAIRGQR